MLIIDCSMVCFCVLLARLPVLDAASSLAICDSRQQYGRYCVLRLVRFYKVPGTPVPVLLLSEQAVMKYQVKQLPAFGIGGG